LALFAALFFLGATPSTKSATPPDSRPSIGMTNADARHFIENGFLPDPAKTPGIALPGVTAVDVLRPGYAKSVRDVGEAEKARVFAEYGIKNHQPGEDEIDHLISLELGGSNDIKNLWPEPYHGAWNAHMKDKLEGVLHQMVRDGRISLAQAQHEEATNWIVAYRNYVVGENVPPGPATTQSTQNDVSNGNLTFVTVQGASPGGSASVTIHAEPGATCCSIIYTTPAGTRSKASGLGSKTANAQGTVSWTWFIGPNTRSGTGKITVECNGKNASMDIVIR
jgi:hypothetical protein